MGIAVLGETEADVLSDLQFFLLDEEDRRALFGRSGQWDADPVLVADRLEDLLDQYPIRSGELLECRLRLHDPRPYVNAPLVENRRTRAIVIGPCASPRPASCVSARSASGRS